MKMTLTKLLFALSFLLILNSCNTNKGKAGLSKVDIVDLSTIDPELFTPEEWYVPYYLNYFEKVANSVLDTGENRGFINIHVWRTPDVNKPYNARIMESILSLAYFYTTDRPWNPYYGDPALKGRLEAAFTFWCNMQNGDGRFSEYAYEKWSVAPTAFAAKFIGKALFLLKDGPEIDPEVMENARESLRKALYISFTDPGMWEHGRKYTNQYANLWGGALMYLKCWPDAEIDGLFRKRLEESMTEFQSSCGYFYERNGTDWGYNLSTHHSDLHVAYHFARGTDLESTFVQKTGDWYDWFAYNAVKEPGQHVYYLNKAIETRQNRWTFEADVMDDPAHARWVPQAEHIPITFPFQLTQENYQTLLQQKYDKMREVYPKVTQLKPGEFWAFSPYAFLHNDLAMWFPSEQQRQEAISKLPYLERDRFVQTRTDERTSTNYSFIRRPAYYVIFNSGKIVDARQRFGMGLLWNPAMGTLIQSQSANDVGTSPSWGTQGQGSESVYETADVLAKFKVNGQAWSPQESREDFENESFGVTYALGEKGTKTIDFNEKLKVSIDHPGQFKEIIPLLKAEDATLKWTDKSISLTSEKGKMTIYFKDSVKVSAPKEYMQIGEKMCQVFEVSGKDKLAYEIVFE